MLIPFLTNRDSMGELHGLLRQMDEVFRRIDRPLLGHGTDAWLPAELSDEGDSLVLRLDAPGVTEGDLAIEATRNGVTIRGERKLQPPEGYQAHWRERKAQAFMRTFEVPCRIDVEKVTATIKHGVLSLRMAKLPEERPKQVTVNSAAGRKEIES
jgi:HSP20 family protein